MRYLRTVYTALAVSMLIAVRANAQTQITNGNNIVATAATGSTGVSATAASANPDIAVKTGDSSTSAFHVFNSASAELFQVKANGNVGIGTPATSSKLTIYDNANSIEGQRLRIGFIPRYDYTLGRNPTTGYMDFIGTNDGGAQYVGFSFNGNVGIGTPTASSKLTIYDNANSTEGQRLRVGFEAGYDYTLGRNPTTGYMNFIGTNDAGAQYIGFTYNGKVGIGTASPTGTLQIDTPGETNFPASFQDLPGIPHGVLLNMSGNGEIDVAGMQLGTTAIPNIQSTASAGAGALYLNMQSDNDVIVGNSGSAHGLQVRSLPNALSSFAGNVTVTGTLTAGTVYANFQDVAEWVPAAASMPAGTVVVLSASASNTVAPSTHAYDTGVAGVVSPTPGLLLGIAGTSKAKIATTGRVSVRVDATKQPIHIGDLLVTSDRPGMAMKSEPLDLGGVKIHRPGTLIGKALEPLSGGEGEILVLLSLQ